MANSSTGFSAGLVFVELPRVTELQYPFSEPLCCTVNGLQQTLVPRAFPGLIEEVDLFRFGLLPSADTHPDEPHRFAGQVSAKE